MLRRGAHDGAQLGDAGFEAAKLEQAVGEIEPGAHMPGLAREHLAELRGSTFELTFEQQRSAAAVQRTSMVWSKRKRACERSLGVGWLGTKNIDTTELDRKLGNVGCKLNPLLEHSLSVVEAAHAAKDERELVEGGRKNRSAAHRALEPIDRLVSASDVAKRQRMVCLEQRIGGVARSLRKRTDGLARTLLDQEGEPQEMQRPGMLRMPAQHVARNALGFIWATPVDRGPTKTKGLLA